MAITNNVTIVCYCTSFPVQQEEMPANVSAVCEAFNTTQCTPNSTMFSWSTYHQYVDYGDDDADNNNNNNKCFNSVLLHGSFPDNTPSPLLHNIQVMMIGG